MKRLSLLLLAIALLLVGCGEATTTMPVQPTATAHPTQAPAKPTVKPTPTSKLAPIPSASELSQLISVRDGKVTGINTTPQANGTTGVALDIQVYNPTQTRIKHINYILMQFFFGERSDVGALNFAYHAASYTGMDDPIAQCGGVSSEYKLGYDENQLWDALYGAFNVNLPA